MLHIRIKFCVAPTRTVSMKYNLLKAIAPQLFAASSNSEVVYQP